MMDHDTLCQISSSIWQAALHSVRPEPLLDSVVKSWPTEWMQALEQAQAIHVIGAGKAGVAMLQGLRLALPNYTSKMRGIVNVPGETSFKIENVLLHAARPVGSNHPTQAGVYGAEQMLQQLEAAGPNDVVICLISGGGSALLPAPAAGLTLVDKQVVTRLLHACGATIDEMNTVRKHLSRIKGGHLAQAFHSKLMLNLIISDVVGDPLDVIASGPTIPDPTTYQQSYRILMKYALYDSVSVAVRQHLKHGMENSIPETPKTLRPHVHNLLIGSNRMALLSAEKTAQDHGFSVLNLGSLIEGDTQEVAVVLAGVVRSVQRGEGPIAKPACILFGGETTVNLGQNPGKGGRNQEFVLAMLNKLGLENMAGVCVVSIGTDGEDGPTDAAGAIGTHELLSRAMIHNLKPQDFLKRHDAYHFFETVEGLIKTGLTGTNVMDVRFVLVT